MKMRPYLKHITNNLKKSGTWKIQLAIANKFISPIDNNEKRVVHSKSDNIELMITGKADKVIKRTFCRNSHKSRYQNNLESIKGSKFRLIMFIYFFYKSHKINNSRSFL